MASFQKRGRTWQYTISNKGDPIRKGGFRTKKEAQAAATDVENKLNKGMFVVNSPVPIDDYFEKWYKLYKTNVSKATLTHYKNTLRVIINNFPNTSLQKIRKSDYQKFINDFGERFSREYVKKVNSHIRSCVRDAVDEGIIHVDFTRNVVLSGKKGKTFDEKHLNYGESEKLLKTLYNNLDVSLIYYFILLALTSGMRFAEIAALNRKDFNFVKNTINISKAWGYTTNTEIGEKDTKTEGSNRVIKMDRRTMDTFKKLFKKTPDNIHKLVFYQPASKYKVYSNTGVNKALKKLLESLGIQTVSIHCMRHTHASVLLYSGVSIQYISERLGHTDIDTTIKVYAHMIKEMREVDERKTIDVFNAM